MAKTKKSSPKKDLVKEEMNKLRTEYEKDVKKLRQKYSKLRSEWEPKFSQGMDTLMHEEQEIENYIKKNPIKAVGAAFVIGLLLGKIK